MRPYRRSFLLAASILVLGCSPSLGMQICKPQLTLTNSSLSEVRRQHRTWTAALIVDASRCVAASGRFEIHFVRDKENAPELEFSEPFTWRTGELRIAQTQVSLEMWMDEAVLDYAIGYVAPCACREQVATDQGAR
jgi:hypothetical protein